jgi:hypothetical protein
MTDVIGTEMICGVRHEIIREFEWHSADTTKIGHHPLGEVYVKGRYGYVPNGYKWYRFNISDLSKVRNAYCER